MMKTITSTAHNQNHIPAGANGLAGPFDSISAFPNARGDTDLSTTIDQIHLRAHMRTTVLEEALRHAQPGTHWGINE